MTYLARKVQLSKWKPTDNTYSPQNIPADAITSDLKTQGNTLSFWRADSIDETHINEAVLAIASALDRAESIDIVAVAINGFDGINLENTPGRTPVEDLKNLHVDASDLNHVLHSKIAEHVAASIYPQKDQKSQCRRYTRADILARLKKAIADNRLTPELLNPSLRAEVEK